MYRFAQNNVVLLRFWAMGIRYLKKNNLLIHGRIWNGPRYTLPFPPVINMLINKIVYFNLIITSDWPAAPTRFYSVFFPMGSYYIWHPSMLPVSNNVTLVFIFNSSKFHCNRIYKWHTNNYLYVLWKRSVHLLYGIFDVHKTCTYDALDMCTSIHLHKP